MGARSLGLPAVAVGAALLAGSACAAPLGPVTQMRPLAHGVELRSGSVLTRITALRDDVVRVQVARGGKLVEDGSWAVLPASRAARAPVRPISAPGVVGFSTRTLRVEVARKTSAVTIRDLAGKVVVADQPAGGVELQAAGFSLTKALPPGEHYFGLGDKTGPLDRLGRSFTLWNTDAYGFKRGDDPLYKAIPFYMGFKGGRAYGVLVDDTFRSRFDFGKARRDQLRISAAGGALDYYVMAGPTPKDVEGEYAWLTGPTPPPPLWSLGYQQSRYSYGAEAEVRALVDRFHKEQIPLDVVWLDIDYQDRNRPFTVNAKAFPDMPGLVADLAKVGVRMVFITDLHIARAPGQGYAPYDSGAAGDHFLRNPDGSTYVGPVWPGPSVFPEFTRARTRAWWGSLYKTFYGWGVAGFWNDMDEPSVFNGIKTVPSNVRDRIAEPGFVTRTTTQAEIHNVFGQLNSRATYEGLLALKPDRRPFVMTRATYAGGQRYAATWTGDNSATWDHLRLSTPMLENLGLSGFALAGDDLGGFIGSPSADLLTRWLEQGMFNPIARDHTAKGTLPQEPWVHGPEHTAIRKRYIEERYRLLPYNYSLADETARTGVPMMRPLFLEFPDAARAPLDLSAPNEFMWGGDLLVAPPPAGERPAPYAVLLPPGGWYDYWTGRKVAAAGLKVAPDLATLPIFVRAGAIIPRQPLVQTTAQTPEGPLQLDVYPGPDCHGTVYQDAGDGFGYRSGQFYRATFRCRADARGLTVSRDPVEGSFRPWWREVRVVVHDQPHGGRLIGADNLALDAQAQTASFTVSEAALAKGVTLAAP